MSNKQHIDERIERIRKNKRKRRNKKILFIIQLMILVLIWHYANLVTPYTDSLNNLLSVIEIEINEE